jgi:hypothetical protein
MHDKLSMPVMICHSSDFRSSAKVFKNRITSKVYMDKISRVDTFQSLTAVIAHIQKHDAINLLGTREFISRQND